MLASVVLTLGISLLAAPLDQGVGVELRYTGALTKAGREADGTAVKRFSLYGALTRDGANAHRLAFVVSERGGGGWSWPERFGSIPLGKDLKPASSAVLRLLFEYEGNPIVVSLPCPVFSAAEPLKIGAKWTEGKEAWEVVKKQKIQDRECWQIQASTNFGRKRTLWVDIETPLVVALEERVFVGQGDEHSLTMQLESQKTLDEKQLAHDLQPLEGLLKLQTDLKRADNEFRAELSDAQLKLAGDALPALQKAADDTPFSALVAAINKDVKSQLQRTDEVGKLAEKFVGKPAPALSLVLTDKKTVDPATLKDKIIVLHFWEYQGEPLVEPYGQVGYLDFLNGKRKKLGVQVYGVAVDARFGEEPSAPAALKSIQKLKNFMNLGYDIAIDDGKLLTKFGDPRRYGAKLPLCVVIGPDGKVAHYHSGFYKINPDEGLRELDEVLIKLIKEQKGKAD